MEKLFSHIFIQTSFSLVPSSSVSINQNYLLRTEDRIVSWEWRGEEEVKKQTKNPKNLGASRFRSSMSERNRIISSGCILVKEVGTVLSWLTHIKAIRTYITYNLYKFISHKRNFSNSQNFFILQRFIFSFSIHTVKTSC